jgi:hypothetical protein
VESNQPTKRLDGQAAGEAELAEGDELPDADTVIDEEPTLRAEEDHLALAIDLCGARVCREHALAPPVTSAEDERASNALARGDELAVGEDERRLGMRD